VYRINRKKAINKHREAGSSHTRFLTLISKFKHEDTTNISLLTTSTATYPSFTLLSNGYTSLPG